MAEQALPVGAVRRRAMFGLFDADGWSWAGIKAAFWFMTLIFLLGYIPNLAYYFTVSDTVKIGYNVISPINWCPESNDTLPCPAPAGALVPWQTSPDLLSLPSALTGAAVAQSGVHVYVIGGTTPAGVTADVHQTEVSELGNFLPWTAGPALPEPRTGAALASVAGVPYLVGGLDANGKPTATVFSGTVEDGKVTGWVLADGSAAGTKDLTLPEKVSGASIVAMSTGLYLFGGRTADGLSNKVYSATLDSAGNPQPWTEVSALPMPEPRADATALPFGDMVYIFGGTGLAGPTSTVYRLDLQGGMPTVQDDGSILGWATAPTSQSLPAPRSQAASFSANGALYVIGGVDASGTPQSSTYWAIPDPVTFDLPQWHQLDETQLPDSRASAAIAAVGSYAFIVGGQDATGPLATSVRANISPLPPYFQLGILGATIPGLSIKGEIGQQLGYLNAMGVGMTNFVLLVLLGYALSHRDASMRLLEKLSRGKIKGPREDEYVPGT